VSDTLVQNSLVNKKFLETVKIVDGKALHLEYHQERLNRTLNRSHIHILQSAINPPPNGLYRCRIVYDMERIDIEYLSYSKRIVNSLKLIYDDTIVYDKKYANRDIIDRLFTQKEDADDILIIKNGFVTDTSIANIAFYDEKEWFTPKNPLLKGTCRARLLATKQLKEREIKVSEIKNYKKIALMNAMVDLDIIASENIEDMIC